MQCMQHRKSKNDDEYFQGLLLSKAKNTYIFDPG